MKDYIIVAPKYNKSNGVRTLYRLAEALKVKGHKARIYAEPSDEIDCEYVSEITDDMKNFSIVVYPETIFGNPLGFKNVVRYVLYFPGKIGGQIEYNSQELVVTFDALYYPKAPILSIPCLDRSIFYKDDSIAKTIDCYFVYKRGKFREIEELKNMVEINTKYPATRQELGDLLRKTKTLYSYDNCSLLLDEALACGCDVKIITNHGFIDYIGKYDKLFYDYENQLENFIKLSQQLNYDADIRRRDLHDVPISYRLNYYKYKFLYYVQKYIMRNDKKSLYCWFKAECKLKLSRKQRNLINV